MMNVLISFDKFKHALTAQQACDIAAAALREVQPTWRIHMAPLADGGDGFCDTLTRSAGGRFETVTVTGPAGEQTEATFGIVDASRLSDAARLLLDLPEDSQKLAVIELAQSSGLSKIDPKDRSPWTTTTHGMGETMKAAVDRGAQAMIVGLGGSATHDLALGALQALGFRFLDADGEIIERLPTPETWPAITSIEAPSDLNLPPIRIACDVEHALTGPQGAAAVFGPQKGLELTDLNEIDSRTSRIAIKLCHACNAGTQLMDTPKSGAAGGAAFGLMAALGARPIKGAEIVFAWAEIDKKLAQADIVVTGEGRFDASSLEGKAPGYLARRAATLGKRACVLAGSVEDLPRDKTQGIQFMPITPPTCGISEAIRETEANLRKTIKACFAQTTSALS